MSDSEPGGAKAIGKYDIIDRLGHGGMGDVYLGRHQLLDRPAAIKVLKPRYANRRELTERFFREAKIAAALKHPGLVNIYDFGYSDDGSAYLAMEFLQGEDLRQRLRREKTIPPETVLNYTRQLLSVLEVAHDEGIVHRDLKPENVFIVANPKVEGGEEIKLLDFGVAKLAADASNPSLTQTGEIIGTPTYMAPEQCRATGDYDGRTDLYSLGCIMYEMIAGKPPFMPGGATQELYLHHLGTPAPRLGERAVDLDAVVARLLQKEPEDRFDDVKAVVSVLDRLDDPAATQVALAPRMTGRASLQAATIGPGQIELRLAQDGINHAATVDLRPSNPTPSDPAGNLATSAPAGERLLDDAGDIASADTAALPQTQLPAAGARRVRSPLSESVLDALATPPPKPSWVRWAVVGSIAVAALVVLFIVRSGTAPPPRPAAKPTQPAFPPADAAPSPADAAWPAADASPSADAQVAPKNRRKGKRGPGKRGPGKRRRTGTKDNRDFSVNPF